MTVWIKAVLKEEECDDFSGKNEKLWAMTNQTNIRTVLIVTLGKLLSDVVECAQAFPSAQIPS